MRTRFLRWTRAAVLALGTGFLLTLAVAGDAAERRELAWAVVWGTAISMTLQGLLRARAQRRLQRAEAAWHGGAAASEVLDLLPAQGPLGRELAYRVALLRGRAQWGLGFRDSAWTSHLEAQLLRLPLWVRPFASRFFDASQSSDAVARLARGERLLHWAPEMGRLRHALGIQYLREGTPEANRRAWALFTEALPLSSEDPLVLEDIMLASYHHGLQELAERALRLLEGRHGDPRLPWDRAIPALHLLRAHRPAEALATVRTVPTESRTQVVAWLVECAALRQIGDRDGAWATVQAALQQHPGQFRLWMEAFQTALERRAYDDAWEALEEAGRVLRPGAEDPALRQEWNLRRAEFAFWVDEDPVTAWEAFQGIPAEVQRRDHGLLRLRILAGLGRYEEAHSEVQEALQVQPEDTDLLLLQAECMAGLEAWEALLPFLNEMGDACREQSAFWHLRGLAYAHLEEPGPARADLDRAARMDPNRIRYVLDAGHAAAELGDWERAELHWRQALQVDPQCEEAFLNLSEARRELMDFEGSRRFLRECLLHHPDSQEAQTRLAELEAN